MLSLLICSTCGAFNEPTHPRCYACGHLLATRTELTKGSQYDPMSGSPAQPLPIPQHPAWEQPRTPSRLKRRTFLSLLGAGMLTTGVICAGMTSCVYSSMQKMLSNPDNLFVMIEHNSPVYNIAWSGSKIPGYPDHHPFIVSACADKTVPLNDLSFDPDVYGLYPPTLYHYSGHKDVVTSVSWSPDSTCFASASRDGSVHITQVVLTVNREFHAYDDHTVTSGKKILTYTGHKAAVNAVAWMPDGTHIASASQDGTVQVWDAQAGKIITTYRHLGAVHTVAWSPDGKLLASGDAQSTVHVWDPTDGHTITTYQNHWGTISSLAWSPDGIHIASASTDGTVQIWFASDGTRTLTYTGHKAAVRSVDWSDSYIASASDDKTVQIWNALDASIHYTYRGHSAAVNTVAWAGSFGFTGPSMFGPTIASGSSDKTVQIWDVPS